MKIAFALVNHTPTDERVWFQETKSLKEAGHDVYIISTRTADSPFPNTYCFDDKGMPKRELIKKVSSLLRQIDPKMVICDNPIAILAANDYKSKAKEKIRIIYDITEWYPSKKNLRGMSFFKQVGKGLLLVLLAYYTGWLLDGFIFGEKDKAKPFRFLFPWKKHIHLPYYAYLSQIRVYPIRNISEECILFYSGSLTIEKGFGDVLQATIGIAKRFPSNKFVLQVISSQNIEEFIQENKLSIDLQVYKNLRVQALPFMSYPSFCEKIGEADIFFDLRQIDIENTRCLPIKLFYYMAAERPVIYSQLKAIKKEVQEIDEMGFLVNPKDTNAIISCISRYLTSQEFYESHCKKARQLAEKKYNWINIEQKLVHFIRRYE